MLAACAVAALLAALLPQMPSTLANSSNRMAMTTRSLKVAAVHHQHSNDRRWPRVQCGSGCSVQLRTHEAQVHPSIHFPLKSLSRFTPGTWQYPLRIFFS